MINFPHDVFKTGRRNKEYKDSVLQALLKFAKENNMILLSDYYKDMNENMRWRNGAMAQEWSSRNRSAI